MAAPVALTGLAAALGLVDAPLDRLPDRQPDPPQLDRRHDGSGDRRGHHVALVGGGGKTTVAFAIAETLAGTTIVTTTTKMGAEQDHGHPILLSPTDREVAARAGSSPIVVWAGIDGHKAIGVDPAQCDRWFGMVDNVVVEADGSRQHPFKAPQPGEPVVPATATTVLSVIGAGALGRVIGDRCHRPLRVAALAGCQPYERLTPARAAIVLLHPRGPRRATPTGARYAIVVNRVDAASAPLADELIEILASRDSALTLVAVGERA